MCRARCCSALRCSRLRVARRRDASRMPTGYGAAKGGCGWSRRARLRGVGDGFLGAVCAFGPARPGPGGSCAPGRASAAVPPKVEERHPRPFLRAFPPRCRSGFHITPVYGAEQHPCAGRTTLLDPRPGAASRSTRSFHPPQLWKLCLLGRLAAGLLKQNQQVPRGCGRRGSVAAEPAAEPAAGPGAAPPPAPTSGPAELTFSRGL